MYDCMKTPVLQYSYMVLSDEVSKSLNIENSLCWFGRIQIHVVY